MDDGNNMLKLSSDDESARISIESMNLTDDQVEYGTEDQIIRRECRSFT